MKRICAVYGKETGFFTSQMVRNNIGTEICKNCLKKVKINTVKLGCSNMSAEQVVSKITGEPVQKNDDTNRKNHNTKLITCRVCGKEISRQAQKCPHCGHPTVGKKLEQTVKGLIFAPFIVIAIIIAIAIYIGFFHGLSLLQ